MVIDGGFDLLAPEARNYLLIAHAISKLKAAES